MTKISSLMKLKLNFKFNTRMNDCQNSLSQACQIEVQKMADAVEFSTTEPKLD